MGERYLIDTNVVIEFLNNSLPMTSAVWLQEMIDNNEHALSIINRIELLSYSMDVDALDVLSDFIDASTVFTLSEAVTLQTIGLRQSRKIKLPDAIIAATALVHDLALITRNVNDFKNINGLTVLNSYSLSSTSE